MGVPKERDRTLLPLMPRALDVVARDGVTNPPRDWARHGSRAQLFSVVSTCTDTEACSLLQPMCRNRSPGRRTELSSFQLQNSRAFMSPATNSQGESPSGSGGGGIGSLTAIPPDSEGSSTIIEEVLKKYDWGNDGDFGIYGPGLKNLIDQIQWMSKPHSHLENALAGLLGAALGFAGQVAGEAVGNALGRALARLKSSNPGVGGAGGGAGTGGTRPSIDDLAKGLTDWLKEGGEAGVQWTKPPTGPRQFGDIQFKGKAPNGDTRVVRFDVDNHAGSPEPHLNVQQHIPGPKGKVTPIGLE